MRLTVSNTLTYYALELNKTPDRHVLALPTNCRLVWKIMKITNTLAYYSKKVRDTNLRVDSSYPCPLIVNYGGRE